MKLHFFYCALLLFFACKSSKTVLQTAGSYRVAFYNVENLFDCVDEPGKFDEEFTPTGKNQWTLIRYQKKLEQLNQVFAGMGYPTIIGLSEVENATVLNDLCRILTENSGTVYNYKHIDSPDKRGIDCAFVYRKEQFAALSLKAIRIPFPEAISGEPNYTSRDILYVKGLIHQQDTLHCFVNHWPSRVGGVEKSEPRRMHVARYLKRCTDSLYQANARANILLMGDFNDEPDNRSVYEVLNTRSTTPSFYNLMDPLDQAQRGSYNYRGTWNMLDQILVSPSLQKGIGLHAGEAKIFEPEWLCFKHPRFGKTPNRTYGGPNYYGGFSDHFPVYVDLK